MAERSGFFQASWDDSLLNPETGEETGYWDRAYLSSEFAKYFSLFVANGVFESPTNQLKVVAGIGNSIIVSEGFAFINGNWYHNDEQLILPIQPNNGSTNRIDSVRIRFSDADRSINAKVFTGDVDPVKGDTIYDLVLAEVVVNPSSVQIMNSNISDKRPNETVCGFVKGLMQIETTKDLFLQYQSIFEEWFNEIKDQLQGDLGARLQLEFVELNEKVDQYQEDIERIVNDSNDKVTNFVDKDYVIPERTLNFIDKKCIITDSKVTVNTLVDVYFTADTITQAEECEIYVDSENGRIVLTSEKQPTSSIKAALRVRIR